MGALQRHWAVYLIEALGLAFFVVSASLVTTLLEYPGSPVHQAIASATVRRIILGFVMAAVIAAIAYSPWGKRSGAHINPAITWTFFRLRKIRGWDATFYTIAQFAGAIAAVQLMRVVIGVPYQHAPIDNVITKPGMAGPLVAFVAEFVISFLLMFVLLRAVSSKALEKRAGLFASALIALYLTVEAPLSGMSLNPARTFGSAFAARHWADLWLYFVAPMSAMLLAAEVHSRIGGAARSAQGPMYPVEPTPTEAPAVHSQ